jgi:hypothetical protein
MQIDKNEPDLFWGRCTRRRWKYRFYEKKEKGNYRRIRKNSRENVNRKNYCGNDKEINLRKIMVERRKKRKIKGKINEKQIFIIFYK